MNNSQSKFGLAILLLILQQFHVCLSAEFLRVQGNSFYYGADKVFLSGPNLAWNSYGFDFGNGRFFFVSELIYKGWVDEIANNGGNTLRFWLHVEGDNSPEFNSDGFVTGTDGGRTILSELINFLDYAASRNVFVIIVLWNGALMRPDNFKNLVWDETKLQSYIDNALKPMVRALVNKPALASWEIMNEPEGSVRIQQDSNPCYDTTMIGQHGAGWSGAFIPMELFLKFINWQASAIRQEDPKALITIGSWSEHAQSDAFSDTVNHYKDNCLIGAGGKTDGTIDYYQIHTYSWEGAWSTNSPFKKQAQNYALNKPLIIGEFSADCAQNEGIENLFNYSYDNGYSGTLSWQYNEGGHCSDSKATQNRGMQFIRYKNYNGLIDVKIQ